jgi:hypothetical protein
MRGAERMPSWEARVASPEMELPPIHKRRSWVLLLSHPFDRKKSKRWGTNRVMRAHPSRKNKSAARVGHP